MSQREYMKEEECNAYFEPKINPEEFPVVKEKTMEEEEEEIFKIMSKMYRFDSDTKEWKERGVGEVKFMKHKESGKVRVVMRRKQIFKLCANHYILPEMDIQPLKGSEKAFIYYTPADFADEWEEKTQETLCFKFRTKEDGEKYHKMFIKCQEDVKKIYSLEEEVEEVTEEIKKLSVEEEKKEE